MKPIKQKHSTNQLKVISRNSFYLTTREQEVLNAIGFGYSTKEIANYLYISEYTVHSHKKNLFSKFKVNSIPKLLITAIKNGSIKL